MARVVRLVEVTGAVVLAESARVARREFEGAIRGVLVGILVSAGMVGIMIIVRLAF